MRIDLRLFLKKFQINNGQQTNRVKNENGNKPFQLIVASAFPEGNPLPDSLPNHKRDKPD